MPYFDWIGIDWFGNISKGTQFARSQEELSYVLLSQEIGLVEAKLKKHTSIFNPIKLSVKVQFFKELSILLDSGILLPKALSIIEKQIIHSNFKKIVKEIYLDVSQGISINDSIIYYNDVFDSLTIQIIKTGSESGNLATSLKLLSEHLERRQLFLTKLRSALILPLVTFILFIFVTGLIFTTVIPSFSSILLSSGQELSFITKTIFNISNFLKDHILVIFFSFILFLVLINKILKNEQFKHKIDPFLIKIPLIGQIIIYNNLAHFFQSSSLLLNSGIHLIKSLEVSIYGFSNLYFKAIFEEVINKVNRGSSLSNALGNYSDKLSITDIVEMIKIGEESGKLGYLLNQISELYYEKSYRLINLVLYLLQPILMLILGILIALLIFAIYIPIFNLTNFVT